MISNNNRDNFGYAALNRPFKESHFHHLHYRPPTGGVDECIGLHIPKDLHTAIKHNHLNGRRMHEMNLAALQWYMLFTVEELNPVAVGLYHHYKSMTRKQIQLEQNMIWTNRLSTPPPPVDFSYLVNYSFFGTIEKIARRRKDTP